MQYIGNYKSWIQQSWLDEVLSKNGLFRPREGGRPGGPAGDAEWQRALDAGYKEDAAYFQMFTKNEVSFQIPDLPFVNSKFHWWITKMMPSDFMPIHTDPHTVDDPTTNRYWIPLTAWAPGHTFVYEDFLMPHYDAGDVWVYSDATALHGAANYGFVPRVVLQVSTYD
jgi:hypothetical protein